MPAKPAKAAASAAAPPAGASGPSIFDEGADLRAAAMMEAKSGAADLPEAQSCPRCQGYLDVEQRLCMRCGYDRKRGAKVMTRVEADKEVKSDWVTKRRQSQKIDQVVGIAVGSACLVLLAAFSVGFYVPILMVVSFPLLAIISLGTMVTLVVFAFIDTDRSAAVCGLACVPIVIVSTMMLPVIGPLFWLGGLFMAFLAWARLMYFGATQGRSWLRAMANTVVAVILIFILESILMGYGVLPTPQWMEEARARRQQQQGSYDQP
ncbi:MAG: hypothetical protein QM783_07150 [Phycisphaerales bacterium]